MQYEMSFDERANDGDGRPGLLTARSWRAAERPDDEVLASVRRVLPVTRSVSDELLTLVAARGHRRAEDLERFFFPSLEHLHDPFGLDEMDAAVDRVLAAAAAGERVAVHGDFDVDGLTGTSILAELFTALEVDGRRVDLAAPFVPDRIVDGYGVSEARLRVWGEEGVDLLVTVDTGSAAHAELALARELGMHVVVLDHHIFEDRPASVQALVNPCRPGNRYPTTELCGAGVAFKLVQAVTQRAPQCLPTDFISSVLDLAALGTIADQMSLLGENRVLVLRGLERLQDRATLRPGLAALLSIAGLDGGGPVSAGSIAYQVAPRLNACGRVGRVQTALDLLLTRDEGEARRLAKEADETNERRKQTDLQVKEDAVARARPFAERGDPGLVLGSPDWHRGVIGISAARLVEIFNVPTILFAVEGDQARGSARSVPGLDVKAALDRCASRLLRYGGHQQAAGMCLKAAELDAFRGDFLDALREAPDAGGVPERYDLELSLSGMSAEDVARLTRELTLLEPFGEGNRAPVFRCNGLRLSRQPTLLGRTGEHLRFAFAGPERPKGGGTPAFTREFISFGSGRAWAGMIREEGLRPRDLLERRWDILFRLEPNTWRPRNRAAVDPVQQHLVDIRPSEAS